MLTHLISSFQLLMKKGLPVVVFRTPGGANPILIAQEEAVCQEIEISATDKLQGFLVSGFSQSMKGKTFVLRPDIVLNNERMDEPLLGRLESFHDNNQAFPKTAKNQTKETYLKSINNAISKLKSGTLQKIVLSRCLSHQIDKLDLEKLFSLLDEKYEDAFVYLLFLPGQGIWFGATPETLLKVSEEAIETVALAGTMPIDSVKWTEKEKEEQELVSDYIEKALQEEQVTDFVREDPVTIHAAKLAHLQTTFSIPAKKLSGKLGSFISRLHPTPAVCGLPKQRAFALIQEIEQYDRELYTGFLGPWNMQAKSHLFVNLRCAQLTENSANLFVGGGITSKSDAEAEWEETVNKSKTLLSVLKKR